MVPACCSVAATSGSESAAAWPIALPANSAGWEVLPGEVVNLAISGFIVWAVVPVVTRRRLSSFVVIMGLFYCMLLACWWLRPPASAKLELMVQGCC